MPPKTLKAVDNEVGDRIRIRRTQLGMSQEKLAAAVGITFQQIQKYEKGTNRVSSGRLQQIAVALGKPVSWFFGEGEVVTVADVDRSVVMRMLSSKRGIELAEFFVVLPDPDDQHLLIDMARRLARPLRKS